MIRSIFLTLTLHICVLIFGFSQGRQELEDTYKDANAYFYFEDYEEALALYLSIYHQYPNNANINYRIGLCYLNVTGSKQRAIPYLERASTNLTRRYNENSLRETRAPIDAIFYLGNAYFIDNKHDEALEAYELFRSHIKNERSYDMEYFNHQVEAVKRSRVLQNYPINFLRRNIGSDINNRFPNYNPTISGDGKTLAYTTKERFYQAILVARKEGDSWGRPRNITLDLVVDGNCSTLSLSYDGTELYLFKDDNHVGNIYVSNFVNGAWSPMRKLNENINTDFYETHASISADGKKLYFTSNRAGGYGNLDIYVSERNVNGDWGPAKNLGPNINTRFNENTPFITTDNNTLFFSSEGHSGVGGYDIVFSHRQPDGTWSKPINLGFPINTTDDDLFYQPIGDGSKGLMAVFDPKGFGDKDITQLEIFLPKYQRSIVTPTDFFTRRAELPKITLVVDTVNVAGVALLNPTKPEHKDYLNPDKLYTLFFSGKPFDIRDPADFADILSARLKPKVTADIEKPVKPQPPELETKEIEERIFAEEDKGLQLVQLSEFPLPRLITVSKTIDSTSFDTIESQKKPVRIVTLVAPDTIEIKQFEDILIHLTSQEIKPLISVIVAANIWALPQSERRTEIIKQAHRLDSLGKSKEFIRVFAKLNDLVSIKSVEKQFRQSRQIAQTTYDEDFFFRLQRLKRNASPRLTELFNEAILTQPNISTFETLWEYFYNHNNREVKPYLDEFLVLLIESGLDGYFELSNEDKAVIFDNLTRERRTALHYILTLSIFAVLLLAVIIYRRRKA